MGKWTLTRRFLFDAGLSAVSVAVAAVLCLALGESIGVFADNTSRLSYLSRYYNRENRETHSGAAAERLCVINCHEANPDDSLARRRIAQVLDRLSSLDPAVVGLDIRFKGRQRAADDALLETAILRSKENLVVSRSVYDEEKRSFFDTDSAGLLAGYANIGDFYMLPSGRPESFSEKVLSKAGLLDESFREEERILDFSNVQFEYINAQSFLNYSDTLARRKTDGKIVLIGDKDDEKDIISTPFLINGREWIPGVFYHAYCINSMRKGGPSFSQSWWLSLLICLLLCFVYTAVAGLLSNVMKQYHGSADKSGKRKYVLVLILKPVLLFALWVNIPYILMSCVTYPFRFVPNLTLAMVSVALISFFENLINHIKEKYV